MTTFANAIEAWIGHRRKLVELDALAKSTFDNQTTHAIGFLRDLGGHLATGLRKSHIDLWVAARLRDHAPVTVAGEIGTLRQILNWLVDERIIDERPRLPTVSVPNVESPLPADADFMWYLKHLPQNHAEAIEFMLLTGLAPHELERLECRDRKPHGPIIIGGRPDFAVKQESRRREIPLSDRAETIWTEATMGGLPNHRPFPLAAATQKAMRRLFLSRHDAPPAADGLTPKMMRKWFSSKVASQHAEAVLQRLLGHAPGSKITRKHYVRSNDEQLEQAVKGLRLQ